MIHVVIVHDTTIFRLIREQTEAKKVPLMGISYHVFSHGNIRIIGEYNVSIEEILASVMQEFNPDTVFFLRESYPVSDEKLSGDIVLPNVFFQYNNEIESMEIGKKEIDAINLEPIFLEHYPLQGDYNFELFGLSVGGIHVSGMWNDTIEDFRIRLRLVYENDTFDSDIYTFVHKALELGIQKKIYPVAYTKTEDMNSGAKNIWSIVQFIIGSIDPDLILEESEGEENKEE